MLTCPPWGGHRRPISVNDTRRIPMGIPDQAGALTAGGQHTGRLFEDL